MSSDDEIWRRDEIESPCTKICLIHPKARICTVCHRSIEEIGRWSRLNAQERERILAELPGRKSLLRRRRGGRMARVNKP